MHYSLCFSFCVEDIPPPPPPSLYTVRRRRNAWGSRTVDEYDIEAKVGEGMYGYVYKAQHKRTGQTVALKKIRMEGQQQGVWLKTIHIHFHIYVYIYIGFLYL